ncbi:MAG: LamG-like jellyroll fold domain-containing protein [Chthoniobacterales bacterium]
MIRLFCICLIFLLTGVAVAAPDFNLYYFFENNADPTVPANSGGATQAMHFNADTRQTTTQHKFGQGSMEVMGDPADKLQHHAGFTSLLNEWNGAIHKMSVVTWIRPSLTSRELCVLSRIAYPAPEGTMLFRYFPTPYNCYSFSFVGKDRKFYGINSDKFLCVLGGEWMHMAMTFNEGKVAFYINGLPVGGTDLGNVFIPEIKAAAVLEGFYNLPRGSNVDDFGLFTDRVLSAADIEKIYNNGLDEFLKTKSSP